MAPRASRSKPRLSRSSARTSCPLRFRSPRSSGVGQTLSPLNSSLTEASAKTASIAVATIGAIESDPEGVEVLFVRDRQRVRDHDLADRAVLQPIDRRTRQQGVGGHDRDRVRAPLGEELGRARPRSPRCRSCRRRAGTGGRRPHRRPLRRRRRCGCPSGRRLSMNARSVSMSSLLEAVREPAGELAAAGVRRDDRDAVRLGRDPGPCARRAAAPR